jgi:hypothetical protein
MVAKKTGAVIMSKQFWTKNKRKENKGTPNMRG